MIDNYVDPRTFSMAPQCPSHTFWIL